MTGIHRLDELIEELEASPDDEASQRVYRALETFLDVQRTAFARVIEVLRAEGHAGVVERFLEDPLLASILRGYRLVEPELEEKVRGAVEALGYGDRVRLVGVQSGVARLEADADPKAWMALKTEVDAAIRVAAPELVGVAVARREPANSPAALPVFRAGANPPGRLPLIHLWALEQEPRQKVQFFERELFACAIGEAAYVFDNQCPAGGEPLDDGLLEGFLLTCRGHGLTFDVRTGRCRERSDLGLGVVPTRVEAGVLTVQTPGKRDVH